MASCDDGFFTVNDVDDKDRLDGTTNAEQPVIVDDDNAAVISAATRDVPVVTNFILIKMMAETRIVSSFGCYC
jgi:hypothetical protein